MVDKSALYTEAQVNIEPVTAILMEQLRRARLTDRQLTCLAMYYYDGVTQQAIAARLSVTRQAVCRFLAAGRKKLHAAGMAPKRLHLETAARLTTLDTAALDRLSAEDALALW